MKRHNFLRKKIIEIKYRDNNSRLTTSHESGVQTNFPNMISSQQPTEESLHTQTVATVFTSSKLSLISVPKKREKKIVKMAEFSAAIRYLPREKIR